MIRQRKTRTIGWNLPIASLQGPLESTAETIVEEMHSDFVRWGTSTGTMREEIVAQATKVINTGRWEEPVATIETKAFGQFASLMSSALTNRSGCVPKDMIGEVIEMDTPLRQTLVKVRLNTLFLGWGLPKKYQLAERVLKWDLLL